MRNAFWRCSATAALALVVTACATTPAPGTIADTAARAPQLSTLNRLIAEAGLGETLRGPGPYTVFAPSDDAFKAIPAKTLAELGTNKELLKSVLTYHVLPGKMLAVEVKNGNAKTVHGASLALARAGEMVTVEEAVVVQSDVAATNGVVHVIDRVLLPPKR
ncbi:MAG: fasciclin domain-containing protein [Pseudomonadota bacterium]